MNTYIRVLIALCIPAGLFALTSFVPRLSPAVMACRNSPDASAPCWGEAHNRFRFRETTDPSGAVQLVRTRGVHGTDVETTGSLTPSGLSQAVPLPPRRPKDLGW